MAGERNKPGALARLAEELVPGSRVIRTRRLRGGIGARMHVLDIEQANGTRLKVSLRRFTRDHRFSKADHVAHEYRILQFVEEAGIPAPRPLLLDAEGRLFGMPAMVLTYLPGRPLYKPRDVKSWVDQLADSLLKLHALTNAQVDLS
ncbi:MAG: phosphotransferase, partial [Chloroflexi bacterium]|nr:phosphotransferase [Chloroflexota bacterium]